MKCGSCRDRESHLYRKIGPDNNLFEILLSFNASRVFNPKNEYFCGECIKKAAALLKVKVDANQKENSVANFVTQSENPLRPQTLPSSASALTKTATPTYSEMDLLNLNGNAVNSQKENSENPLRPQPLRSSASASTKIATQTYSETDLVNVQRRLVFDDTQTEMEWADVTVVEEPLNKIYNSAAFWVRQTDKSASLDSECDETESDIMEQSRLNVPVQKEINVPSTSPMKNAKHVTVKAPYPSIAAPENHVYVYVDKIDENEKYYVLTEVGLQLNYKSGRLCNLVCANRLKKPQCKAYLRAPATIVTFRWNLFSFNDDRNHTCYALCNSLRKWDGSSNLMKPAVLKINSAEEIEELLNNLKI